MKGGDSIMSNYKAITKKQLPKSGLTYMGKLLIHGTGTKHRKGDQLQIHVYMLMQIDIHDIILLHATVYPKKYAHGFCFVVLCCRYTLTDFPISIKLTSLALWQSNDCPSASKATLMNMDRYFMWIHYKRLHNHNKAKHNKTVCIFLGIYCTHACLKSYHNPISLLKYPGFRAWRMAYQLESIALLTQAGGPGCRVTLMVHATQCCAPPMHVQGFNDINLHSKISNNVEMFITYSQNFYWNYAL